MEVISKRRKKSPCTKDQELSFSFAEKCKLTESEKTNLKNELLLT